MPKFMTYQRPAPVNKQSWNGRPTANPHQPVRRSTGPAAPEPHRLVLPPLLNGPKLR